MTRASNFTLNVDKISLTKCKQEREDGHCAGTLNRRWTLDQTPRVSLDSLEYIHIITYIQFLQHKEGDGVMVEEKEIPVHMFNSEV